MRVILAKPGQSQIVVLYFKGLSWLFTVVVGVLTFLYQSIRLDVVGNIHNLNIYNMFLLLTLLNALVLFLMVFFDFRYHHVITI